MDCATAAQIAGPRPAQPRLKLLFFEQALSAPVSARTKQLPHGWRDAAPIVDAATPGAGQGRKLLHGWQSTAPSKQAASQSTGGRRQLLQEDASELYGSETSIAYGFAAVGVTLAPAL